MLPTQPAHILVVDDYKPLAESIGLILRSGGHAVCVAEGGCEALQRLKDTPLKLVISDLNMPKMSGFELISAIRWRFPHMPIIAMSGTYTADQIPRTVSAFYAKGKHSPGHILSMVDQLLSQCYKKQPMRAINAKVQTRTSAA